ncbi:hypothetical protein QUF54_01610, partial [Candidatus Marithioploca araucensis]|nr:hypothetical protein [Candidatus Marithioploca araucensis]
EVIGGFTDTTSMEAITFDLTGKILYAADGGQFGTLDLVETGKFVEIGDGFGTGTCTNGDKVAFDDVDGLAVDFANGDLYGTQRRESPSEQYDVLFQIDPQTGEFIEDAFNGDDCVVIEVTDYPEYYDIDDIASDPKDGKLYAIVNTGAGVKSALATLDLSEKETTGNVTATLVGVVQTTGGQILDDIESMSIDPYGVLYGTTGNGGAKKEEANPPTKDRLYQISKTPTGVLPDGTPVVAAAGLGELMPPDENEGVVQHDFEAVSCIKPVPDSCFMYAVHDEGKNDSQIFVIRPFAESGVGAIEPIGPMYKDLDLEGLAILGDGILYGTSGHDSCYGREPSTQDSCGSAANSDGFLYKVNTNESSVQGMIEPLGPTGYSELSGLAVNQTDNSLWAWARGKKGNRKKGPVLIEPTKPPTAELVEEFEEFSGKIDVIVDGETVKRKLDIEAIAWSNDGNTLYAMAYANDRVISKLVPHPKKTGRFIRVPQEYEILGNDPVLGYDGVLDNYGYSELWAYDKETKKLSLVCPKTVKAGVEGVEMQPNGLLVLGTHRRKEVGMVGFDPKKCEILVTRKFKGLNYDDIESIEWPGQSCPHRSWLYETSYDAQIALVEYEPVPYQLEETLREALDNAGMEGATTEVKGDEITVFYNTYQFTVLAQESPGYAVKRARREGSDAKLVDSATTGCKNLISQSEATSWTLCPTSPDPDALENMLEEIGEPELDEGNGSISLMLPGGMGIEAILGMAITPPVILKGEALPPVPETDTAEIVFDQDTNDDGTTDKYTVEYPDGAVQDILVIIE